MVGSAVGIITAPHPLPAGAADGCGAVRRRATATPMCPHCYLADRALKAMQPARLRSLGSTSCRPRYAPSARSLARKLRQSRRYRTVPDDEAERHLWGFANALWRHLRSSENARCGSVAAPPSHPAGMPLRYTPVARRPQNTRSSRFDRQPGPAPDIATERPATRGEPGFNGNPNSVSTELAPTHLGLPSSVNAQTSSRQGAIPAPSRIRQARRSEKIQASVSPHGSP